MILALVELQFWPVTGTRITRIAMHSEIYPGSTLGDFRPYNPNIEEHMSIAHGLGCSDLLDVFPFLDSIHHPTELADQYTLIASFSCCCAAEIERGDVAPWSCHWEAQSYPYKVSEKLRYVIAIEGNL